MPTYRFRCDDGYQFDARYSMSAVPLQAPCEHCDGLARRMVTAPHLSKASSSAYQVVDRTMRSAHEPEVVTSLPPRTNGPPRTRAATNPLQQRLPRS